MESENEDEEWNKPVYETVNQYNKPCDNLNMIKPGKLFI